MAGEKTTETEILRIHSFPALVNTQNFHLLYKCKDKPEGYLEIDCTMDTLMGCECEAVKLCLQICYFLDNFILGICTHFFFPEQICDLSQDMSIKLLEKCLMDMDTLSDKNSYAAVWSWLKIDIGQTSWKRKQILCIWIPHHTEHIPNTPKQHSIDFFVCKSAIVFMISEICGLIETILTVGELW